MNERIERLRMRLQSVQRGLCSERADIITKAYQEYRLDPPALKRAKALKEILCNMTIYISDDELIVGNQSSDLLQAPLFPEFSYQWLLDGIMNRDKSEIGGFHIDDASRDELSSLLAKWQGHNSRDMVLKLIPEPAKRANDEYIYILTGLSSGLGHITVDYERVLKRGLLAIKKEYAAELEKLKESKNQDIAKAVFYQAGIIVCDAAIQFAQRYAELALELSEKAEEPRKTELKKIAEICRNVPKNPAKCFYEALQSFWFVHLIIQIESNGHSISPGRFDVYCKPFYDLSYDAGMTDEEAKELLLCLWIKFNEITKIRDDVGSKAFGGFPMFQNLIIGGVDENGFDSTNDLSILCLDVSAELKLPQPSISLRCHAHSPERILKESVKVVKSGIGMPAYFNDEVIIPILLKAGCTLEEARGYCEVGCVEPHIPGKMEGFYSGGFMNMAKVLEITLNNGENPITGNKVGLKTGEEFSSYDMLEAAFKKQLEYFIKLQADADNIIDYVHANNFPTPFVSLMVDDCFGKGLDVRQGGAKYNFTSPNLVGLANTADSLAVIKKKVFEEKNLTLKELKEILEKDYEGYEVNRQELINNVPKYGNDERYVDSIARDIADVYCKEVKKYRNQRGGIFEPGLQSISAHALFVGKIGATPDGRRMHSLLSDGGVSPAQGKDNKGPTAVLKSVSMLNMETATNGALLNVKFHPSVLEGPQGEQNIISLIRAYFAMQGQHIQFNVVSAQTLRDAQINPERYSDLVVRVAGFSVLFTSLDPVLQNDIIERTENN